MRRSCHHTWAACGQRRMHRRCRHRHCWLCLPAVSAGALQAPETRGWMGQEHRQPAEQLVCGLRLSWAAGAAAEAAESACLWHKGGLPRRQPPWRLLTPQQRGAECRQPAEAAHRAAAAQAVHPGRVQHCRSAVTCCVRPTMIWPAVQTMVLQPCVPDCAEAVSEKEPEAIAVPGPRCTCNHLPSQHRLQSRLWACRSRLT